MINKSHTPSPSQPSPSTPSTSLGLHKWVGLGNHQGGGRSASGVGVKVLLVVGLQLVCRSPFKEALTATGMSILAGLRVT